MNRDWMMIGGAALVYSYLFYLQSFGINFLLFTAVLAGFTISRNQAVLSNKLWWAGVLGALVSAIGILLYGNTLSFLGNLSGLMVMSFSCFSSKASTLIGLLHSAYSILGSFVFIIIDWTSTSAQVEEGQASRKKKPIRFSQVLFYLVIPCIILGIFFTLYRFSNQQFKELTAEIDLSFISVEWIFFLFGGILLMYGFFRHQRISEVAQFDEETPNLLTPASRPSSLDSILDQKIEYNSGLVLLGGLNILLLSVNVIDIIFLSGGAKLPEGVSLSDSVHQGIGALIFSIICAVSIILFYFRGRLNFLNNNKVLRMLAFLWIAQNMFMVFSTGYRNFLYVNEWGLTYKKIGVFVYLLLTAVGLIYTFIKVKRVKTNWFLVRYTSWTFYGLLMLSPIVNWDRIIVNSQIQIAQKMERPLDVSYLARLSEEVYPDLYRYFKTHPNPNLESRLDYAVDQLMVRGQDDDWRSFNFRALRTLQFIENHFGSAYIEAKKADHQRSLTHNPFKR